MEEDDEKKLGAARGVISSETNPRSPTVASKEVDLVANLDGFDKLRGPRQRLPHRCNVLHGPLCRVAKLERGVNDKARGRSLGQELLVAVQVVLRDVVVRAGGRGRA